MAILALFSGNLTKPQYETIRKEINWEGNEPAGGILHVASFDEDGHIHVADVWDSPDALNSFVTTRLMPAFQQHGFEPPEVLVLPAHTVQAYKAIEKYRI